MYSTPKTYLAALAAETTSRGDKNPQHEKTFDVVSSSSPLRQSHRGRTASSAADSAAMSVDAGAAAAGPGFPVRPAWDMLPHGFEV